MVIYVISCNLLILRIMELQCCNMNVLYALNIWFVAGQKISFLCDARSAKFAEENSSDHEVWSSPIRVSVKLNRKYILLVDVNYNKLKVLLYNAR